MILRTVALLAILTACTGQEDIGLDSIPLTNVCGVIPADCGDGELDLGERCDDGNNVSGDLCSCDCSTGIYQDGAWEGEGADGCSAKRIENTQTIQDYIDSFPTSGGWTSGTPLEFPPNAILRLCDHDSDGVILRFNKRVLFDGNGAKLVIPKGDDLGEGCTLPAVPNVAIKVEGDGALSVLENLVILSTWVPSTQAAPDMVAVDIKAAQVTVKNFRIVNVGTGIRFADLDGGGPENANQVFLERNQVISCGFAGFYSEGNDAQAGTIIGNSVTGCSNSCSSASSFYESSFLGNNYISNHSENNDVGYRIEGIASGNRSTWNGNYAELSDGVIADGADTTGMVFVGGTLASRYRSNVTLAGAGDSADVIGAAGYSYIRFGGIDFDGNELRLELPAIGKHAAFQFSFVPAGASASTWPTWYLGSDDPGSTYRRGWSFFAEDLPGGSVWPISVKPAMSFFADDLCNDSFYETYGAEHGLDVCGVQ